MAVCGVRGDLADINPGAIHLARVDVGAGGDALRVSPVYEIRRGAGRAGVGRWRAQACRLDTEGLGAGRVALVDGAVYIINSRAAGVYTDLASGAGDQRSRGWAADAS